MGPIGIFVRIAPGQEEFAGVAERSLANTPVLDRFIVTNDHDNSILRRLRRKAGCQRDCGIYQISVAPRYQLPTLPDWEGVKAVTDVLLIEDDLVFNSLVDFCRIDSKAVSRDRELSEKHLLVEDKRGQKAIRGHISEVYFLPRGDHWTAKNGSLAVFSNEWTLRKTIGIDQREAIETETKRQRELTTLLEAEQRKQKALQRKLTASVRGLGIAKKKAEANEGSIERLTEKISRLRDDIDACATMDTSDLEDDVRRAEDTVQTISASENKLRREVEESRQICTNLQKRVNEFKARNAKSQKEISTAQQKLVEFLEAKAGYQEVLNNKQGILMKYRDSLKEMDKSIQDAENTRDDALMKSRRLQFMLLERERANEEEETNGSVIVAERLPEEVDPSELAAIEPVAVRNDMDHFKVRIKRVRSKINEERKRRLSKNDDNIAEALSNYVKAKQEFDAEKKALAETEASITHLEEDLKKRKKRWIQLRNYLERIAKLKFTDLMRMNKYAGSLEFDHDSHTLDLIVRKLAEEHQSESRDVKALR